MDHFRDIGFTVGHLLSFFTGPSIPDWEVVNQSVEVSEKRPIIAFGDSLTQGVGASREASYPSQLSRKLGVPILNLGISGNTTSDAMKRFKRDVLKKNPSIVIIGLGGNDARKNLKKDMTFENLGLMIDQIHAAGGAVILLSFDFPLRSDYERRYWELAEEKRCALVTGTMSEIWSIVSGGKYLDDEIHPNEEGYTLMTERISPVLQSLLKQ